MSDSFEDLDEEGPEPRIPVAVLGATGAVGQRLVSLLSEHPWFELAEVLASPRSAGRRYSEVTEWLGPQPLPAPAGELFVGEVGAAVRSPLVFSALEASVALGVEEQLARAGKVVVSNASAWRMDPRVPLVVPEVNPDHLRLLSAQVDWPGAIVTNPNCSTIGLVLALAPLTDAFGLERVQVVTLQALSGAGAPSARTLGYLANVVPHIAGEAEKLERETHKILGEVSEEGPLHVEPAELELWAQCNRVPVVDGHTLCVTIELSEEADEASLIEAWSSFTGSPQELELPSAPEPVVVYHGDEGAPQPLRHLHAGEGMAVHVGGLRRRSATAWQFTTLSHNTLRGAAGGALLLAELLCAMGFVPED